MKPLNPYQIYDLQIFSLKSFPADYFFFYILMSFDTQKDIFMKSSLSSFSCVKSKNLLPRS